MDGVTRRMRRICLLGANGQVGAEVALLLARMPGVDVVPVIRTHAAGGFLRWLGLETRVLDVNRPAEVKSALRDVDLVVDFAMPTIAAGRDQQATMLRNVIDQMAIGAPYVYMSTTSAFGMPLNSVDYRNR